MVCTDIHSVLAEWLKRYEQVCVIADEAVTVDIPALQGMPVLRMRIDEADKSLEAVQQIWDFLFAQSMTRRGLLIAVGGGVLTDIAGFAAATYKRGIDYINIPTTLLAMVDASSGGKTGFNYRGLKNSIGIFAPPVETIICPSWLRTLPAEQFLSGFAEMLKTGLINGELMNGDAPSVLNGGSLWSRLLQYDLETMPLEPLAPLIEACVAVKQQIVDADPREENLRKALNLGHTFGHALEEVSIQNSVFSIQHSAFSIPHGYAVLYGLIAELYLSVTLLGCPKEPLQQLTQLMLHYYGRPQCKCSDRERLIALMQQDKKNERAAEINCTLIRSVGSPVINQVITVSEANEAWDYLFSL
ncbi:MAG: 3-dehydroquinate synthase [Paludibacteraceae bacterium]|nr:3-dehydroquinate synthase [Paludibacteraceae bacterium]